MTRYSYNDYLVKLVQEPDRWVATIDESHPWFALNNRPGEAGMTPTGYGPTPGEAVEDLVGSKQGSVPHYKVLDLTGKTADDRAGTLHYHFFTGWRLVTVDQGFAYLERRGVVEHDTHGGGRMALHELARWLERK